MEPANPQGNFVQNPQNQNQPHLQNQNQAQRNAGEAMANNAHDGFRQAMLKTALETIPQLREENYSIWKDKMTALLKLRGVLTALNNVDVP
jgi:hypothetical protein